MNNYGRKFLATAFLFALVLSAPGSAGASSVCSEPVPTQEGPVRGRAHPEHAACAWKGIPYAEPPIADLRFRAPQPARPRDRVLEADSFGPACLQKESFTSGGKSGAYAEDCLYLNIWRPAKSGVFPVMFWIHGGGYTQGAGDYEMYEGAKLAAEREVVVVTINYRLGVLGFLALAELAEEDPAGDTGNYGMLDQIRALKWVRDNITAFGGDPDNMTIFGESAGGVAVCTLLASPLARGLFQRAVIESGACDLVATLEKGFKAGENLVQAVGCQAGNPLPCLRQKTAQTYLETKAEGFNAAPHVGGKALPQTPIEAIRSGNYHRVPVMVGSNRDEWKMGLVLMGAGLLPRSSAVKAMRKTVGPRTDEILELYPASEYRGGLKLLNAVFADGFGSRAFAAAEGLSARTPTYMYRFDWDQGNNGRLLGAFHGLEIPFAFGTLDNLTLKRSALRMVFTKRAVKKGRPLSGQMMSYWSNFAKTGDPNGEGLPEWPAYNPQTRKRLHLDSTVYSALITGPDLERYLYFSSLTMEDLRWGED